MARLWTHDELLLALNLYFTLPFGQYHQGNREVQALAQVLDRTPGSVAMKLSNFASLDPYHEARGIKGLPNVSQADRQAWQIFTQQQEETAIATELALEQAIATLPVITEVERTTKVRLGQQFFRKKILANYGSCCICGLPLRDLLVASHIIPWSERADLRLNERNGLCLCAIHDKAFDRGLISISPDYRVHISNHIEAHIQIASVRQYFAAYHEQAITPPRLYPPHPDYLSHHFQKFLSS